MSDRRERPARHRRTTGAAAVAYLLISCCFFGVRVLRNFGSAFIGTGTDPQLFAWAFAWWPHALDAGENPVVSHALWTPLGSDLAWATAVPGLALPLAPVTLLFGPIAAYNVWALLAPAASALAAFLLCRRLTGAFWPSLAGGYLFGFSSYLLGHELGHPHLTAAFVVPLVALVCLRFLDGELDGRGVVLRVAPLLALQVALGTEILFTLSLALVAAFTIVALLAPRRRAALRSLLGPLAGAYAFGALLASPLLVFALRDFQTGAVTPTGGGGADLVSFAFPTSLTALGGGLAQHFDPSIPLVSSEDGQYLGLPTLAILAAYLWRDRARARGRVVGCALALALLATLGAELRVRGRAITPLPWRALEHLPLFDNVVPGRLSLYVALLAAVGVALWAADPGRARPRTVAAVALAVVSIVPNLRLSVWELRPEQPAFYAAALERGCLTPGETTLLLPPPFRVEGLLWQAEDDFRFGIADAGLNAEVPGAEPDRAILRAIVNNKAPHGGLPALLRYARAVSVGAILVDDGAGRAWRAFFGRALPERVVGGVDVYTIGPMRAGCGQA